jgi:hypothetical protein
MDSMKAREASATEISCVASASMAVMASRRSTSALSISALRWMMQALSHCLSSGWPGDSGFLSSSRGLRVMAGDGLPGGVVPLACELAGVLGLPGPFHVRTKQVFPAALVLPASLVSDLGRLQSRARCHRP